MPRPGVDVVIVDDVPPGAAALNTGTAFMVGQTQRGPAGAVKVPTMRDYQSAFGDRSGGQVLYDSVSAFFSEGGGDLFVSRLVSGDAAIASGLLGTSIEAEASSPGDWGNGLTLALAASGASFVLTVTLDGEDVEKSPPVATAQALSDWSHTRSRYTHLDVASVDPLAAANVALAGGDDGAAPLEGDMTAALDAFEHGYGPGQVLMPGDNSAAAHSALLAHADTQRRCVLLDADDTDDALALIADVESLYDTPGVRYTSLWAPWAVYASETPPATVSVPYSAVEAGIIARVDRAGNPNAPAAGADGIARLAIDLTQKYSDADRQTMNEAGIDLAKIVNDQVRSYGYRTAAGPAEANWLWFGNSRTLMAIAWECEAVAETYVLKQIDGRGQIFSRLNKDLRGVCARYFDMGALFGASASEAFDVVTDPSVNTVDTIKAGEIHAVIKVKVSPAAEWVVIEIVKVPVDRPVSAAIAA
jgi:uncharacterized protein